MFQPRTFKVPLYQGDYQQRIAKAEQSVAAAEKRAKDGKTPPRLMGDLSEVDILIEAHNTLVAEAEADGCTTVTLRALGRKRWNTLVSEHPPRTDEATPKGLRDSDAEIGVNDDSFGEALLSECVSEVSDETPTADLLEVISAAQYDMLYRTAFTLNRDGGPIPKALSVTIVSPSAAATVN